MNLYSRQYDFPELKGRRTYSQELLQRIVYILNRCFAHNSNPEFLIDPFEPDILNRNTRILVIRGVIYRPANNFVQEFNSEVLGNFWITPDISAITANAHVEVHPAFVETPQGFRRLQLIGMLLEEGFQPTIPSVVTDISRE